VAHQPAISFSISFQHPFNRAGGRTSIVGLIRINMTLNNTTIRSCGNCLAIIVGMCLQLGCTNDAGSSNTPPKTSSYNPAETKLERGDTIQNFNIKMGPDGRSVILPDGWSAANGSDGRLVAVPPGGTAKQGSDGRLVVIPSGWHAKQGSDGRLVAGPPEGAAKEGSDGRLVVIPRGWNPKQGRDGRVVAVPPRGNPKQGSDGRVVALPSGWNVWKKGGRLVTAPRDATVRPTPGRGIIVLNYGAHCSDEEARIFRFCLNPE
jgi:hypothetical protein